MRTEKIIEKLFYFSIILLGLYLLIRLINQSQVMWIFPLDFANDYSAHIAKIHFLVKYGFSTIVPNWFNGFPVLKYYHPLSAVYGSIISRIVGSPQVAIFLAMISFYIAGFFACYKIIKNFVKDSQAKVYSIILFLFIFANPIAIGYFLRIGKYAELMGFVILLCILNLFISNKEKELTAKFYIIFSILEGLLLLAHISVFIASLFLVLGFWLSRKGLKERISFFISFLVSLVLTSFWWIPFIFGMQKTFVSSFYGLQRTMLSSYGGTFFDIFTSFLLPLIFVGIFVFYYKIEHIRKKEFYFYLPSLILGILIVFRIAAYLPWINRPIIDTYNNFFMILTAILLLNLFIRLEESVLVQKLKLLNLIKIITAIAIIMGIILSINFTSFFPKYTQENKDLISTFEKINEKESIWLVGFSSYSKAYYSYSAVHNNLYTPYGWGEESVPTEYRDKLQLVGIYYNNNECDNFKEVLKELKATKLIGYKDECLKIDKCEFNKLSHEKDICVYNI